MRSEVEVFAVNASNSNHAILNRWVIYAADNNHEVYLETTKNYKISKVHASTFESQKDAVEFIMRMDRLCTNGQPIDMNTYLSECQFFINMEKTIPCHYEER